MNPQDPTLVLLREHLAGILAGSIFVFIGVVACLIAALRRRADFRLLVWVGLFIGMYGARMLADAAVALRFFSDSPWPVRIQTLVQFLLLVPAIFFWIELSTGVLRRILQVLLYFSVAVAALGIGWYFISGSREPFLPINLLLAILSVIAIGTLVSIPGVRSRYLIIQSKALPIVMPMVALFTLYENVMWLFGFRPAAYVEPIAFGGWILAIGLEAAKYTFDKERRLFVIEGELETARQIQSSILPGAVPIFAGLRIAASYKPMSAVAGDFYQFLPLDDRRVGILVADVTGHGVPAALIASMIKVAMQSVVSCATEPARVIGSLNRILTPELRGRLTSAAYLYIDTEQNTARYCAAGHPPLLQWSRSRNDLLPIESNGLLFGVANDCEYPECSLALAHGDRFLLYTDGLTEPENAHGEAFGEHALRPIVAAQCNLPALELSSKLLAALHAWQPANGMPQDDITLIVADVI